MAADHNPLKLIKKNVQKLPITRTALEEFTGALRTLNTDIQQAPNEEYAKNLVRDFLRATHYKTNHINVPKGNIDLSIHMGSALADPIGVIVEVKQPANKAQMPTPGQENVKGLHELLLYYLREREAGNMSVRHLVATNGQQWLVSDEDWWDNNVYKDKELLKAFKQEADLEKTTDRFYKEIAKPFFERKGCPPYAWLEIEKEPTDKNLKVLYRLLSPEHLLKAGIPNDANSLNKDFYEELLYILGLEQIADKGKKLIKRVNVAYRRHGTLLENTISKLNSLGKLANVPEVTNYGSNEEDQLFSISLELIITWLNRILFLKLLEGQLIKYNYQKNNLAFLTTELIPEFDQVEFLFFDVLNTPLSARNIHTTSKFSHVPYLNSMLFEISDLERNGITISNLVDAYTIPLFSRTILKDGSGKRLTGEVKTLEYLLRFLAAYDFGAESTGEVQEESKSIINAAVLGLIFEKINGYKDGSFFTPGYITMYMCREAIQPSVVQKLNNRFGWDCQTLAESRERLEYHKKDVRQAANEAINSLRICDPAVGSGHFLVSALNELLYIKGYLRIWQHPDGKRIQAHRLEVDNDELLVVKEEDETLFGYGLNTQGKPKNEDIQLVQESLFAEKRLLIEQCLYGVDINPKSVAICRLRLWIELLKNTYYTAESGYTTLETLPNLDINIGCGNSLLSRFGLQGLPNLLPAAKANLRSLAAKLQVQTEAYRSSKGKVEKDKIRSQMRVSRDQIQQLVPANDKTYQALQDASAAVAKMQNDMFAQGPGYLLLKKLLLDQMAAEKAWEAKKAFFNTALEWRTEFPDLLDKDGNFKGFDVVIGNPPYIRQEELGHALKEYLKYSYATYAGTADLYVFFVELGLKLLADSGQFHYILPNKWMRAGYGKALRKWAAQYQQEALVDFGDLPVFDEATTYPLLWQMRKLAPESAPRTAVLKSLPGSIALAAHLQNHWGTAAADALTPESWNLASGGVQTILAKMRAVGTPLGDYLRGKIYYGIKTGFNEAFVIDAATKNRLIAEDPKSAEIIKPFLAGRDIKRYQTPVANKFLIFTRRGIDVEKYPSILAHLSTFKIDLTPKGKDAPKDAPGRKPGTYKWYEIQDSVDYFREFENSKIIVPTLINKASYVFDFNGIYSNDKTTIIPSESLELLGLLNSRLLQLYMHEIASTKQHGYFEYKPTYIAQLPAVDTTSLTPLVQQILDLKKSDPNADTAALEQDIDRQVYSLYGLTEDEIALVEGKI